MCFTKVGINENLMMHGKRELYIVIAKVWKWENLIELLHHQLHTQIKIIVRESLKLFKFKFEL